MNETPRYVVVEQPGGRFEIWQQCSDPQCEAFHDLIATAPDAFKARRVKQALEAER